MTKTTDKGFTLVEMLLAVVISGILLGAISQATIVMLRTMDSTNRRIAGSNDIQLVAGYFNGDVASAQSISTTGTKEHAAPAVQTTEANTRLVAFWTLKTVTAIEDPPAGMSLVWNQPSATALTSWSFDESVPIDGDTANRVAVSATGTSSVAHSVALKRASSAAVTRRDRVSASSFGTSLLLSRPPLTQPGDVMLAHVAVAGATASSEIIAPAGWEPVESHATSASVKSMVFRRTAVLGDQSWTWSWPAGGSREWVGGVVSYSGANSVPDAKMTGANPCGGETPLVLLSWTDRPEGIDEAEVAHQVAYNFASVEGDNVLERRRCTDSSSDGAAQTLATSLASAAPVATCSPASCESPDGRVSVTLRLTERPPPRETTGRVYRLQAATRVSR